jgi:hypothetical protein
MGMSMSLEINTKVGNMLVLGNSRVTEFDTFQQLAIVSPVPHDVGRLFLYTISIIGG